MHKRRLSSRPPTGAKPCEESQSGAKPSFGSALDRHRNGPRVRLSSTIPSAVDLPVRLARLEMSEGRAERRLAAILAVDVAGYSRLMGADEEGTHERLKAHFAELVHPKVTEHRGRVVKNTGDGLLSEFASVVDAVRCAVEVQQEMIARNAATPAGRRIEFRMGINVGDIIIEASDIFGDGVNIAARLEALAEPGGICLSAAAHEQVRDRLDLAFDAKIPTLWSKMTQRDGAGYRLRPGCPDDGIIS